MPHEHINPMMEHAPAVLAMMAPKKERYIEWWKPIIAGIMLSIAGTSLALWRNDSNQDIKINALTDSQKDLKQIEEDNHKETLIRIDNLQALVVRAISHNERGR